MKAERNRHHVGAAGMHGHFDREGALGETGNVRDIVPEREDLEDGGPRFVPRK